MKEWPVFIPHRRERLGGVITLGDDDATRGVVLLITGLGAPRSHQHRLWTTLARRLAAHRLATIRFDYLGMGDSTSFMLDDGPLDRGSLVDQARSALSTAVRGTRNQRIAVVGNCVGARAALEVAAGARDCVGAVCILPALAPPGFSARAGSRLANTRLGSALLRSGTARRMIRTAGPGLGDPIDADLLRVLPAALRHGRVLFLYGERDRRTEPARAAVERSLAKSPVAERARCEFRSVPDISLEGFDQPESRSSTMGAVESFLVERFDEADSRGRAKSAITF